jgi:RNA polymerase sigma factor (sigma-70 family)
MYVPNEEIMDMFRSTDGLGESEAIAIQNQIVEKTKFLVYKWAKGYKNLPNYEDLVQEGFYGLTKAVRKFDHNRFPNFFVYADQWVKQYVMWGASHFDVVYNPSKRKVVYSEPDVNEEDVKVNLEAEYMQKQAEVELRNAIDRLSYRDQKIIKETCGVGAEKRTLTEIGNDFGYSYENIRQIKHKIIGQLGKDKILRELGK